MCWVSFKYTLMHLQTSPKHPKRLLGGEQALKSPETREFEGQICQNCLELVKYLQISDLLCSLRDRYPQVESDYDRKTLEIDLSINDINSIKF